MKATYYPKSVVTPPGILLYAPGVWHPSLPEGATGTPTYNARIAFSKQLALQSPEYRELSLEVLNGARGKFGDQACHLQADGSWAFSINFKGMDDGDKLAPEHHGKWILKSNAKEDQPPLVFDKDGVQLTQDTRQDIIYSGAIVRLVVRPYFYDKGGNGGTFGLQAVMALGGGERLSSTPPPPSKEEALQMLRAAGQLPAPAAAPALPRQHPEQGPADPVDVEVQPAGVPQETPAAAPADAARPQGGKIPW